MRGDAGSGVQPLLWHVTNLGLAYSVGVSARQPVQDALAAVPKQAWRAALDPDGHPRRGGALATLVSGCLWVISTAWKVPAMGFSATYADGERIDYDDQICWEIDGGVPKNGCGIRRVGDVFLPAPDRPSRRQRRVLRRNAAGARGPTRSTRRRRCGGPGRRRHASGRAPAASSRVTGSRDITTLIARIRLAGFTANRQLAGMCANGAGGQL